MKHLSILLLVVQVVSCRPEKKPEQAAGPPARTKVQRILDPAQASSSEPKFLLKTPRIWVGKLGGIGHPIIENAEQAEGMLSDLRTLPPSVRRDQGIVSVIRGLAKVDPDAARSLLEGWDNGLISEWLEAAQGVTLGFAASDSVAAARFIEESVPREAQTEIWVRLLHELPPAQRVPFLESIPDGEEKLRIAASIVLEWAADDPVGCAGWLDGFAAGLSQGELGTLGNPSWYPLNHDKRMEPRLTAFRAAETREAREVLANEVWKLATPVEQARLIPELEDAIPDLAKRGRDEAIRADPAGYASALSDEQIAAVSTGDMCELIRQWAEKQPQAAMDWAMANERPEAAAALMRLYFLEPQSALAMASKLPPGLARDSAVSNLSQQVAHDGDVESAKALLPLIEDVQLREGARRMVERNRK